MASWWTTQWRLYSRANITHQKWFNIFCIYMYTYIEYPLIYVRVPPGLIILISVVLLFMPGLLANVRPTLTVTVLLYDVYTYIRVCLKVSYAPKWQCSWLTPLNLGMYIYIYNHTYVYIYIYIIAHVHQNVLPCIYKIMCFLIQIVWHCHVDRSWSILLVLDISSLNHTQSNKGVTGSCAQGMAWNGSKWTYGDSMGPSTQSAIWKSIHGICFGRVKSKE